jgi:hypothetical protein
MAKKKRVGKVHHRRRKVGASGMIQDIILGSLAIGAGAVTGAFLVQAGSTAFPSMPAWSVPAGVAATGLVLPLIVKKNVLAAGFGGGLLAIGAVMTLNQTGAVDVPGISGLAMGNNAPPGTTSLSKAVGRRMGCAKVGAGPSSYLNQVVGSMSSRSRRHAMAVGSLIVN